MHAGNINKLQMFRYSWFYEEINLIPELPIPPLLRRVDNSIVSKFANHRVVNKSEKQ
jgi:hypothetical protein